MLEVSRPAVLSAAAACQHFFPLFETCSLISAFADLHSVPQFLGLKANKTNRNSISQAELPFGSYAAHPQDSGGSFTQHRV